jgi:hypothetical protein
MLRFHLAMLDPNEFNDPSYYRVSRNPAVARTFAISKMGTHTCFPHSAFTHANNTSLEHGGWVTAPDLESILIGRLIIRATYFVASVEKTLVLDDRDGSRLSCSPAARLDILDSDALLLFYVHEDGSQGGDRGG